MSLELTQGEQKHPLWVKIESHLLERLNILRTQNDSFRPEQETAFLRGQIAEIKRLMQIGHGNTINNEES